MQPLICVCGCPFVDHEMIRYKKPFPCISFCGCEDFRLDNLKYLEFLAAQKK